MSNSTKINRGASKREKQPRTQTSSNSDPRPTDDFPTDGEEAQHRREQMWAKDKAEGERRD